MIWSIVILICVCVNYVYSSYQYGSGSRPKYKSVSEENNVGYRDPKFLFLLNARGLECDTKDSPFISGTCMSFRECARNGGIEKDSCATGMGTCCQMQRSCGTVTNHNNTYFVNPNYPQSNSNGGKCELIVNRMNSNICQVRLDFISMEVSQPNAHSGFCEYDVMTVTGGTSKVPTICGVNTGQHLYVNVDPNGSSLKILINADVHTTANRSFNIKISQLSCDSASQAPSGCLQYFMSTSGTTKSFNFPPDPKSAIDGETRSYQLTDQEYAICVRPEAGYCGISWTPDDAHKPYSMFLSNKKDVIDKTVFGNLSAASYSEKCKTDYLIIPGGQFDAPTDTNVLSNRFCGPAFPDPVVTTLQPFNIYYKTDSTEEPDDNGNIGFSLNFRQILC